MFYHVVSALNSMLSQIGRKEETERRLRASGRRAEGGGVWFLAAILLQIIFVQYGCGEGLGFKVLSLTRVK